jgi:hypothetical protein
VERWVGDIPLVGAGMDTAWYVVAMRAWARAWENGCMEKRGRGGVDYGIVGVGAVVRMWMFCSDGEWGWWWWWWGGGVVLTVVLVLSIGV